MKVELLKPETNVDAIAQSLRIDELTEGVYILTDDYNDFVVYGPEKFSYRLIVVNRQNNIIILHFNYNTQELVAFLPDHYGHEMFHPTGEKVYFNVA